MPDSTVARPDEDPRRERIESIRAQLKLAAEGAAFFELVQSAGDLDQLAKDVAARFEIPVGLADLMISKPTSEWSGAKITRRRRELDDLVKQEG